MNENLQIFDLNKDNMDQGNEVNTENFEESKKIDNLKEDENKQISDKYSNKWMIRPCEMYKEEYNDCMSIKARFHQYFIFGEYLDCTQWKLDFENCTQWTKKEDDNAFNALVESESNRRLKRFKAHYGNNVWKKRDKPPEDWDKPLPDWLQEKYKNSYLDHKSRGIKSGDVNDTDTKIPVCTIL